MVFSVICVLIADTRVIFTIVMGLSAKCLSRFDWILFTDA